MLNKLENAFIWQQPVKKALVCDPKQQKKKKKKKQTSKSMNAKEDIFYFLSHRT